MDAVTFQQEAMRHERLLYRISYAMLRNNEDCADAIQEALLRAWQHRDSLRRLSAFRPWLCRILVNACNDMLRKRPQVPFAPLTEDIAEARPDHDPLLLRDALDHLSPEQRTCVVLHYLEGWSVREIADALSLPAGTVKTRLMYGRDHLSNMLRDEVEVEA